MQHISYADLDDHEASSRAARRQFASMAAGGSSGAIYGLYLVTPPEEATAGNEPLAPTNLPDEDDGVARGILFAFPVTLAVWIMVFWLVWGNHLFGASPFSEFSETFLQYLSA